MDTTRADHCSVYGYKSDTTPNLRAFAEEATVFDSAYSPTAETGPSHATMFTSLYPISHSLAKNGLKLNKDYECLAEILKNRGYQTAAVISSFVLDAKFGLAQGFEYYDDDFSRSISTMHRNKWQGHAVTGGFDRRAGEVTGSTLRWLKFRQDSNSPFFLFIHYFDPHAPYVPPVSYASRFMPKNVSPLEKVIARYDGEVAYTDHEVGQVLQTLKQTGLEKNTIVIITSDHGEGLMQRGHMEHGVHIYEEAVRVPLMFRWPGRIKKRRTLTTPTGLVCITPTILDLAGIDPKNWPFHGQSLAANLRNDIPPDDNRPVYLLRCHYDGFIGDQKIWAKGEKFGIRLGKWKYIEGEEENTKELFDLEEDPKELNNLYSELLDKATEFSLQLKNWLKSYRKAKPEIKIDKEDIEKLRTLGYVE